MKIKKTKFENTFIVEHKKDFDNRGFFMRGFCKEILKKVNINFSIKQTNFSYNEKKLTFRGFHYQNYPYSENKVVTCINGKILLVLVNIDKKSKKHLVDTIRDKNPDSYVDHPELPIYFSTSTNWKGRPFMPLLDFIDSCCDVQ